MELRRQLCMTGVYAWDLSVEKRCFSNVCTFGIYNSRQIYIQSGFQPAANLAQRFVWTIVLKFVVSYVSGDDVVAYYRTYGALKIVRTKL